MLLLMRWLHIAGVIIAVGGAVFIRLVMLPALSTLEQHSAVTAAEAARRRFLPLLHGAILTIIVSGLYNAFQLQPPPTAATLPLYHQILGIKILLALIVFTIAILSVSGRPRPFILRHRRTLLTTNLVLAGTIVALSAYLRSLRF